MTTLLAIDPESPEPEIVEQAAAIVRTGGLVAFPTETVYGLGASALDAAAVRRIFEAKRRALDDPVIVHLADAGDVESVAVDVPPAARALATRFWPGPLTLVLPKRDLIPDVATSGLPSVAVRVPSHPVAQALIRTAGVPIAAPSANLFMRTSATTAQHVLEDLDDRVDLILDGGPTPFGIESTVVSVLNGEARLLRPGALTPEAVADVLSALDPPLTLTLGPARGAASPGMLARHYSPNASLFLLSGEPEVVAAGASGGHRSSVGRRAPRGAAAGGRRRVGPGRPAEDREGSPTGGDARKRARSRRGGAAAVRGAPRA